MAAKKELLDALRELQRVSIEMDQLTSRAQQEPTSETGADLVRVVGTWVGLVEGFVQHCPPGPKLSAYQESTRGLESLLAKLEALKTTEEVRALEAEFPPAVDQWSEALTEVIQEVLAGSAR